MSLNSNNLDLKLIAFQSIWWKWMKYTENKSFHTVLVLKSPHIIRDIKNQDLFISAKIPLGPARMDLREESSNTLVLRLIEFRSTSGKWMKHTESKSSHTALVLKIFHII